MYIKENNQRVFSSLSGKMKRCPFLKFPPKSLFLIACFLLLGNTSVFAQDKIYFTQAQSLKKMNLDASGVETLHTTGVYNLTALALDLTGGKMYFVRYESGDMIQRANLDGSSVETIVTGRNLVLSIELDITAGKMYWTDIGNDIIQRSNLDGSVIENLAGVVDPDGLALDLVGGKMYWTDRASGKIQRSNLNGTGVEDITTPGTGPRQLAIDFVGGKMYWATTSLIQRSNMDGSGLETLVTASGGYSFRDISLDFVADKVYWTAYSGLDESKVQRANFNGTSIEDVTAVDPDDVYYDAVIARPADINIKQNTTNIASGGGNYTFGSANVNASNGAVTFTLENLGGHNLTTSGVVSITGTNASDFAVNANPATLVIPKASTTFQITFTPSGYGNRTATVSITNSDPNEGPYTFTLNGTGLASEINVKQNTTNLASGSGSYDFGSVNTGASSSATTFTVENIGNSTLNLTGGTRVVIGGTNPGDFAVNTQPNSPIAGSSNATFQITFTPQGLNTRTATVSIANDDSDENPYTFTLTGSGQGAEINLKQNTTNIASSGSFDMGNTSVGSSSSATTFTIENSGNQNLNLTDNPVVALSGTHAADFTVTAQPASSTVGAASNTTFQVTFTPSAIGVRTATVSIANNDSNENPYTFTLNAMGTLPEINVKQSTNDIASGGSFDFGSVSTNSATSAIVFTIENTGNEVLNLTGNPIVVVGGTHAADFTITTQPAGNTIAAAGSANFTVTFDPSVIGSRTATLTIANNDSNESTYTINLTGTGIVPGMELRSNGNLINSGAATVSVLNNTDFGEVEVSNQSTKTYTISNAGTEILQLSGNPKIALSGVTSGNFAVVQPAANQVNPGQSVTFDINFNAPGTPGLSEAEVSIANNTAATSPFTFKIQATAAVVVNAPSNINISSTRLVVYLNWTDNANNEDDFIIERSLDGTSFSEIGRASQNATSYNDNTVQGNTTYFYRIVASNAFNTGASSTVNIAIGDVLSAPANLSTVTTSEQVILSWQDNNTTETGYAIYRAPSLGGNPPTPGTFQFLFKTQTNETSFVDVSVVSKTTYIYKLQAISLNASNNSDFSGEIAATTQGITPVPPSSANATALLQTEILIEWKDNATTETGYEVYHSDSGDPGTFTALTTTAADVQSYIHQGLISKTTHYYQIRATSAEGPSTFTNPVMATTLSNAPVSPGGLVVTPKSGSELQLEWTDNSSNENGFVVARTIQQFGNFTIIDTVAANSTIYTDTGLVNNTTYFYFVMAFNGDGLSENRTNVASGKTASVPLTPINVVATAKDAHTITVSWNANVAPSTAREATGYKIEAANILGLPLGGRLSGFVNGRKTFRVNQDDVVFQQVATVDAATRSFELGNLVANQKYIFRIRAYNDNGNSPYTTEQSANTSVDATKSKPNAPSELTAESVSRSEIDISWQDNSSNEMVFKIERQLSGETVWTEIGLVLGGTTNFSSTDLLADTLYSYRVRASNEGGDSDYTNVDSTKSECNLIVLVSNVSGGNTICSGKAALLQVNTNVTEATYQWKRNGVNIPNANLPVYNATRTGEYDCQIISGSCRKSSNESLIIIVASGFDVSISITDTLTNTMEASVKGAQSYQWYRDYAPIAGAVNSTYQPVTDGTYFVVVTNSGCSATSGLITSTQVTAMSNNSFSKSMSLSPNPAESKTWLEIENPMFGQYKILITDLQGRVHKTLEGVKQQQTFRKKLWVDDLAPGMYLIKIYINGRQGVQKLIKE